MSITELLLVNIVQSLIGLILGAGLLKMSAKWITKKEVGYGHCLLALVIALFGSLICEFLVGMNVHAVTDSHLAVQEASKYMIPVTIIIYIISIALLLKTTFVKAFRIMITSTILIIGLSFFFVAVMYGTAWVINS